MENKILITGSSGTIGSALCIKLTAKKKKFIPLDIKPFLWNDKIDKKTIRFDLRKSLTKTKLPFKPNMIIHLAANARVHDLVVNPKLALDNYMMIHNVLEYARLHKIEKFIYASSREVYGESSKPKRKEIDTHISNIKSPYTASKFGAEALVHAYHECYNIKPVIIRFSNVYGRYDISERVVPLFIYYALRNRDMHIFGKGKKLDFTFIDDAIDGILKITNRFNKAKGHTFNLSKGKSEPLDKVAKLIINELNSDSKIFYDKIRTGEISSYTGDITLANDLLNYNPKVSLEKGIKDSIIWYMDTMKSKRYLNIQKRNLKKRNWA